MTSAKNGVTRTVKFIAVINGGRLTMMREPSSTRKSEWMGAELGKVIP